jgi:hypothetical protein
VRGDKDFKVLWTRVESDLEDVVSYRLASFAGIDGENSSGPLFTEQPKFHTYVQKSCFSLKDSLDGE